MLRPPHPARLCRVHYPVARFEVARSAIPTRRRRSAAGSVPSPAAVTDPAGARRCRSLARSDATRRGCRRVSQPFVRCGRLSRRRCRATRWRLVVAGEIPSAVDLLIGVLIVRPPFRRGAMLLGVGAGGGGWSGSPPCTAHVARQMGRHLVAGRFERHPPRGRRAARGAIRRRSLGVRAQLGPRPGERASATTSDVRAGIAALRPWLRAWYVLIDAARAMATAVGIVFSARPRGNRHSSRVGRLERLGFRFGSSSAAGPADAAATSCTSRTRLIRSARRGVTGM